MRPSKFFLALLSVFLLLVWFGCSKSSSPTETETDPAKAAERVNQANQIFIPRLALIAASNNPDSSAFNLSSATALYREALQYDPENLDAHFGVALTEVITLFSDPTVRSLSSSSAPSFTTTVLATSFRSEGFGSVSRAAGKFTVKALSSLLQPSAALNENVLDKSQSNSRPVSYYQDIIENKILPVVTDAIQHLKTVTQNPSYAFLITPQMLGSSTGVTYRIDLTEIYLLVAVFQLLTAESSFFVSYNVDYNSSDSVSVFQAWQVSSPFLAFRTNGAQRMKDTRSNLTSMATSIKNGVNFLMNEPPHVETDIIRYNPQDASALQAVAQSMDSVIAYLSTPLTLPNGPTVNFANFFDNAISNFKTKVPTYTSSVQRNYFGKFDAIITWQATTFGAWIFPDPTFNGFFPGMSDAGLKQTFNITASNWTRTEIIEGR